MIFVLAPQRGAFGIGDYLKTDAASLTGIVEVLTFEEVFEQGSFPLGGYIFTSLDKLTPTERELTLAVHRTLAAVSPSTPRLNHPDNWIPRGRLLQAVHRAGLNSFRAVYAVDLEGNIRYPAFVRSDARHTGSLSPLVENERALRSALFRARLLGYRAEDLLTVEYCHTATSRGVFSKYSAMIVGDEVVPRSLTRSPHWVTKLHGRITDQAAADAELEYVETNPHEEWVRQVCSMGGVEYGRVDYGVLDGRPQMWEINTNPTIGANLTRPLFPMWPEEVMRRMAPARELFNVRFKAAVEQLNGLAVEALETDGTVDAMLSVDVSDRQRVDLRRERARRDRRLLLPVRRGFQAARRMADRLGWTRP
jgi:hypothetical protein